MSNNSSGSSKGEQDQSVRLSELSETLPQGTSAAQATRTSQAPAASGPRKSDFTEIARRRLQAIDDFSESKKKELVWLRNTIVHRQELNRQHHYVDITGGPQKSDLCKGIFNSEIDELAKTQHNNHTNSMRGYANIADGFHILSGPSGTGKTESGARSIWPTVRAGHKSCVTTITDVAANKLTTRIFRARSEDLKSRKVLKIEDTKDDAEDDPFAHIGGTRLNLVYRLYKILVNSAEKQAGEDQSQQLPVPSRKEHDARKEAFIDLQKRSTFDRKEGVPLACTLAYQVWELIMEDSFETHENYSRDLVELRGQIQGTEVTQSIKALEAEKQERRKRSKRFQELHDEYNKQGGKVPRRSKDELRRLTKELVERVIDNVWVLVTTADNAGGEFAHLGFDPTLLWCDDAGQWNLHNFFIPLTVFKNWQAVIIMGDKYQEPATHSEGFNEVLQNAKLSVIAHLLYQGHPHFDLVEQYRMDANISAFPNDFWYDRSLQNGLNTKEEDDTKDIMRAMSKRLGIAKKSKNGSVYWLESVVHGVCRHEEGGSSLQNCANADAICDRVKHLIHEGVRPEQITILVYYKSQIQVIEAKLNHPDGKKIRVKVVTADSFVGNDQDIIVADFVTVKSYIADAGGNRDEPDTTGVFNKVTPYMKDEHRLRMLLTSANKGLIVICHLPTLLSTTKLSKAKEETSALAALAKDAIKRDVVFTQTTAVDTHLDAKSTTDTDNEKHERERIHAKMISDIVHNRWNPFPGGAKKIHQKN